MTIIVKAGGLGLVAAFILLLLGSVSAQDQPTEKQGGDDTTILKEPDWQKTPGIVREVRPEDLQKQRKLNNDAGDILSKTIPGMSPPTGTLSAGGQTMRGNVVMVLVDGVPQSTPLRNAQRDLKIIDMSAVERIEVYNLPSGRFNYGASGSIVNYVTRIPSKELEVVSDISAGLSLTRGKDSLRTYVSQRIGGTSGDLGYVFSGSFETHDSLFDWRGDRLSPNPHLQGGISESETWNAFGKIELDAGGGHSFSIVLDRYVLRQDTAYSTVPGVPGILKTSAVPGPPPGMSAGTDNLLVTLKHEYGEEGGPLVTSQIFFQDYLTRFGFSPFFPPSGGQSFIESAKVGGAVVVDLPLPGRQGSRLAVGVDGLKDRTSQTLVDGRTYAPRMELDRLDLFAQLRLPVGENWIFLGGGRYEILDLRVDSFDQLFTPTTVIGGTVEFEHLLFNLGLEVHLSREVDFFAGFAQSFYLADIGIELQTTSAPSLAALDPEGQRIDNLEFGFRGNWEDVEGSLVLWVNDSDEGITFGNPPALPIRRRPERIYGVEILVEVKASTDVSLGGTLSWTEGKYDKDDNGSREEWLPGFRVPPVKLTAFLDIVVSDGWTGRIQVLQSRSRDRFTGSTDFAEGKARRYYHVDVSTTIDVGRGSLSISVQNATNEEWFPIFSSIANNPFMYSAGEGAVLKVSFTQEW